MRLLGALRLAGGIDRDQEAQVMRRVFELQRDHIVSIHRAEAG